MDKYVRITFWIFAGVGAYFLVTAHRDHLIEYLPYVLLLACPLMHIFGHRHGGHHHEADDKKQAF